MLPGSRVQLEPPKSADYSKYADYLRDFEQYARLQVSLGRYVLSDGRDGNNSRCTCLCDSADCQSDALDSASGVSTGGQSNSLGNPMGDRSGRRTRGRKRTGTRRRNRDNDAPSVHSDQGHTGTPLPAKQLLLHEARLQGVSMEIFERGKPAPSRAYSWNQPRGLESILQETQSIPWVSRAMLCKQLPDVQTGSKPPLTVVKQFMEDVLDDEGMLRLILSGRTPNSYTSLARLRSHLTRIRFRIGLGIRDTCRH
jgi:hypothetical protein